MNFQKSIINHSSTYAPVPWWDWNGDMDDDIMLQQLDELKDKGIDEIIIFPCYGLELDYLSREWFDKIKFAVNEAKKRNQKIWIYDDLNWPSGTCGGKLIKEKPELRERGIYAQWKDLKPNEEACFELPGMVLQACLVTDEKCSEIDDFKLEEHSFSWTNNTGNKCRVFVFAEKFMGNICPSSAYAKFATYTPGYLDIMNPDAVDAFIDYTHENYKKYLENDMGENITAFFTDEPNFHTAGGFGNDCLIPYTPRLFELFEEKYNYDLKSKLPELIDEIGTHLKTRFDYWNLITELISKNYHQRMNKCCTKFGVAYTGHLLHEEALRTIAINGDLYECLKYMHIPGMDLLGNRTGFANKSHFPTPFEKWNVTAKIVAGTAAINGAERTICEAFGLMDHTVSLADFKWITDWLAAMGINIINFNNIPYSNKSFRKIEDPGFTAPWWKYFKFYSDYTARVCEFAATGKEQCHVAVLYPTTTAWTEFRPGDIPSKPNPRWKQIEKTLINVTETLCRQHISFNYIFDTPLAEASLENGGLRIGQDIYTILVLPSITVLRMDVFNKIKAFVKEGGKVFFVDLLPEIIADQQKDLDKEISTLFNFDSKKLNQEFISGNIHGEISGVFNSNVDRDKFANLLAEAVKKHIQPELEIAGPETGNIIASVRHDENKKIFLANQVEREITAKVRPEFSTEDILVSTPGNGRKYCTRSSNGVLELKLFPNESLMLTPAVNTTDEKLPSWHELRSFTQAEKLMNLPEEWSFQTETHNSFSLESKLKLDPENLGINEQWYSSPDSFFPVEISRYGGNGMYGTESFRAMKDVDLTEIDYYWVRSVFSIIDMPTKLELILDNDEYGEVWLSDKKLDSYYPGSLWDHANIVFDIVNIVNKGNNTLTIRKKVNYGEKPQFRHLLLSENTLDPIVLSGPFALDKNENIVRESTTIKVGSWHDQGYKYYSGTGMYKTEINLDKINGSRFWIDFPKAKDVIEISVNDKNVGTCPWPPYTLEITDQLKTGINKFEIKITNTAANLLTKPVSSGLTTNPRILYSQK